MKSIYNCYLLYIKANNKNFEVVSLQIDNNFISIDDIFVATKKKRLKKAKQLAKNREN